MGGLAHAFEHPAQTALHVLDAAERSGMPVDARVWLQDAPPRSSHPQCLGVKAAAEQGQDAAFLRAVREAMMTGRRALDTPDALVELARGVEGVDAARFAIDLRSSAVVESFGADLERAGGDKGFPIFEIGGERMSTVTPERLCAAVRAAGGVSGPLPDVRGALARFGRMATPEVAAVCDLAPVVAAAELWALAREHRVRAQPAGSGPLWVSA